MAWVLREAVRVLIQREEYDQRCRAKKNYGVWVKTRSSHLVIIRLESNTNSKGVLQARKVWMQHNVMYRYMEPKVDQSDSRRMRIEGLFLLPIDEQHFQGEFPSISQVNTSASAVSKEWKKCVWEIVGKHISQLDMIVSPEGEMWK